MVKDQKAPESLTQWREEQFMELGFNKEASMMLAVTRDSAGWLIDIHRVRKMISQGCDTDLALSILL